MDTTIKLVAEPLENYFSEFPWLLSVAGAYLSKECFAVRDLKGAVTLHITDSCHETVANNHGRIHAETVSHVDLALRRDVVKKQLTQLCGCMFAEVLEDLHERVFTQSLLNLRRCQESLDAALKLDAYCSNEQFPAFLALAVRYHRYMIAHSITSKVPLLSSDHEIFTNSCLENIRKQICEKWDVAEKNYPLNADAITENSMRYAARYFVWKTLSIELRNTPYKLINPLHDLVSRWLSKPLTTSLIDEYFSPHGEDFRKEACKVSTPSFSLGTLDAIDSDVRLYMTQQTMFACHIGSPGLDAFDTSQGPRPLLLWYGVRARAHENHTAWGEYPDLVVKWLDDGATKSTRGFAAPTPGGALARMCESPAMDDTQWLLALKLWEDSFTEWDFVTGAPKEEHMSPFRDWAIAIDAAKAI